MSSTQHAPHPAVGGAAANPRAPRVAVVLVTYNSADVLPGCLDALSDGLRGVTVTEIVAVDNASDDASVALVSAHPVPAVRVLPVGRNAGYAAAINLGVAALSDCDAVLVLNPDVRLRPGAVAALAAALAVPGVAVAAPRLSTADGRLHPSLRRRPSLPRALAEAVLGGDRAARLGRLGERVTDPRCYERPGRVDWAAGAALLLSRDALRQIGPWDESFLLYSEETEFALRAADQGWSVRFEPAAEAVHLGGESGTDPMLAALLAVNRVGLYRRRHGRLAAAAFHAAVVLGEALRAAAGRRTSRAALTALLFPSRRLRVLPSAGRPGAPTTSEEPTR